MAALWQRSPRELGEPVGPATDYRSTRGRRIRARERVATSRKSDLTLTIVAISSCGPDPWRSTSTPAARPALSGPQPAVAAARAPASLRGSHHDGP